MRFFISSAPVILCILIGCGGKPKEVRTCTDEDGQRLTINERLDTINSYIDSMLIVYKSSIEYLRKSSQDSAYVDEHFQPKASLYYGKIVSIINEVNTIYADRNMNQECYDLFTQQLQRSLAELKNEKKELRDLGYKFQLHNPYIKR